MFRRFLAALLVTLCTLCAGSAANSAPALIDIAIVEPIGRPGHQGFFPIQGQPIVGSIVIVQSRMDSAANGVKINLRNSSGALIGQVPMITPPAANLWPAGIYFAQFQVPTTPFALSVSGTDQGGNNFEIPPPGQNTSVISPQTLAVRLIPTIAEPPPGVPLYVTVQATNYSASNTFSLSLTSDVGVTSLPATLSLALGPNQTAGAQFQLTIPTSLSGAFTVTLTATAASSAPAGSANQAVLELPIAAQPAEPLSTWIRPNQKRDLIHPDRNNLIELWVCDTGVNGNTILVANLPPVGVQHLPVAPQDRRACGAANAFDLTFTASDLVAALVATGLSSQNDRELQVPLTGYRPNGTPLIGYVPLLF
jgi:hypothetical protein